MKRDLSKIAFYSVIIIALIVAIYGYGIYSGRYRTHGFTAIRAIRNFITTDGPTFFKIRPVDSIQIARHKGSGVTINKLPANDKSLVLLSGFIDNNNEIRLIRRDGSVIHKWPVSYTKLFKDTSYLHDPPQSDWNTNLHGVVALPDGSVVFDIADVGVVKMDRFNKVAWTIHRSTHHSVERAEGGGFWICCRHYYPKGSPSPFPPFVTPYRADTIIKVSDDGKIIKEISIPKLFYDNGLWGLLTSTGEHTPGGLFWEEEIIHLNKVVELTSDIAKKYPMFQAGDLMLSLRDYNMLVVFSPKTGKIKWWKIGPYIRQHDPEFTKEGTIILFNNNVYPNYVKKNAFAKEPLSPLDNKSNILSINPKTGESKIIYGGKPNQDLFSLTMGKVDETSDGGLLITEAEGGRVLQTNANGEIIWEYVNRYDENHVAHITEARIYPSDYFSVQEWQQKN